MKIEELISAVQKKLGIQADGRAGPETWGAIYAHIVKAKIDGRTPLQAITSVDARSEIVIATLHPEVRPIARSLVHKALLNGINIKIIDGLRTYAEQDALYAQGRTKPGHIITKAKGGYSNHNFGIAFDIGVFEGSKYLGNSVKYQAVGALGMDLGLEWGGNWKSFTDQPHFQLRPAWAEAMSEKDLLAQLRSRSKDGNSIFSVSA